MVLREAWVVWLRRYRVEEWARWKDGLNTVAKNFSFLNTAIDNISIVVGQNISCSKSPNPWRPNWKKYIAIGKNGIVYLKSAFEIYPISIWLTKNNWAILSCGAVQYLLPDSQGKIERYNYSNGRLSNMHRCWTVFKLVSSSLVPLVQRSRPSEKRKLSQEGIPSLAQIYYRNSSAGNAAVCHLSVGSGLLVRIIRCLTFP